MFDGASQETPASAEPAPTRAHDVIAEAAAKLPKVVADVDRLQAAWQVLASPRTPMWKRVVVGLEVARLVIAKRLKKQSPAPVAVPFKQSTGATTNAPNQA